ncbi:MAG TPA: HAD family hydrolase [Nocardioidaceae bacterium]|nr:HAD family hydrolase [Nocardioidaceae bacterium]
MTVGGSADQPTRLAMWSGPRNISTAMMRSWENRPDCEVLDEPLYAYYLAKTGIDHPAREQVLATMASDLPAVVTGLLAPLPAGTIGYQKHMTHHLLADTDRSWIAALRNVLLIRDPREVVSSYIRSRSHVEPADIGIHQQVLLLTQLGPETPIIDAADFLGDPETYLRWLCDWLGVDFTPAMLSWPAGPRDSDGVWAPHWYEAVRRSTGFEPGRAREAHLDGPAAAVAAACADDFAVLHERRLRL